MGRVTFQFDDGREYRLETSEAKALYNELRAMGRPDDEEIAARIRTASSGDASEVIPLRGNRREDDATAASLARALDHVVNLQPQNWDDPRPQFTRDWNDLRARLVTGFTPMTYDVVSWVDRPGVFFTYTGFYEEGDRVVTRDGRAWIARDVEQPAGSEHGHMRLDPQS